MADLLDTIINLKLKEKQEKNSLSRVLSDPSVTNKLKEAGIENPSVFGSVSDLSYALDSLKSAEAIRKSSLEFTPEEQRVKSLEDKATLAGIDVPGLGLGGEASTEDTQSKLAKAINNKTISDEKRKSDLQISESITKETAGKQAEQAQATKKLGEEITEYLNLSKQVPHGSGLFGIGRVLSGVRTSMEQAGQETARGKAAQQMENMSGLLKIKLAKNAGDTGNLALQEQLTQGKLLISPYDSEGMVALKTQTLQRLGGIFDSTASPEEKNKQSSEAWDAYTKSPEYIKSNPPELEKKIASMTPEEKAKRLSELKAKAGNNGRQ